MQWPPMQTAKGYCAANSKFQKQHDNGQHDFFEMGGGAFLDKPLGKEKKKKKRPPI